MLGEFEFDGNSGRGCWNLQAAPWCHWMVPVQRPRRLARLGHVFSLSSRTFWVFLIQQNLNTRAALRVKAFRVHSRHAVSYSPLWFSTNRVWLLLAKLCCGTLWGWYAYLCDLVWVSVIIVWSIYLYIWSSVPTPPHGHGSAIVLSPSPPCNLLLGTCLHNALQFASHVTCSL